MTKRTRKERIGPRDELALVSNRILALIFDKRYEDARLIINKEQERFPAGESHRFTAFTAALHEHLGEIVEAIALLRQAVEEKPTWLPHLYQLSVLLMDAEHWGESETVLNDLIALSLAQKEAYFLSEARFRIAICLKELGRLKEFQQMKAEIPTGTSAFIGDRLYRIDDIT